MRGILRRRFISRYFRDPGPSRSLSGEPLGSAALRHTVVITGTSVLRVRGVHRPSQVIAWPETDCLLIFTTNPHEAAHIAFPI